MHYDCLAYTPFEPGLGNNYG